MTRAPPPRTPNSKLKTNDKNRTSPRGKRSEPTGQNLPRILRTAATPPAPRPRELPRPCNTECKCTPGSPALHPLESSLRKGRCYARRATFRPSKKNARNSYMNINPSSSIKKVIMESILRGRVAGAARSSARRARPPSKPADILHYFIVLVIRLQLSPWTYMASFY